MPPVEVESVINIFRPRSHLQILTILPPTHGCRHPIVTRSFHPSLAFHDISSVSSFPLRDTTSQVTKKDFYGN